MKPNVGEKERIARILVGIGALVAATRVRSRVASAVLGAVGASGIETGFSRYCPLNELLGIDHAADLQNTPIGALRGTAL